MININKSFTGKFDLENDIVAYVDESGDEGFKFQNNCTEWFVVGGIALTFQEANNMVVKIKDYRDKISPQKDIHRLSLKEIKSHNKRKDILAMLSKHKYLTVNSVFYKPHIDPNDKMCTFPSMYFYGVLDVIERLSWLTQQHKKRRVHILISSRNNIKAKDLEDYLFRNSVQAKANLFYLNRLGNVYISTPTNHEKLLLADYTASALFQALEKTGEAKLTETSYANIFLKGRLYSSNHPKYKGVWTNGLKCTPKDTNLIEYSGILEEGSHEF